MSEEIKKLIQASEEGTGKWKKSEEVLRFYGKDDFEESGLADFFRQHDIPVYTVVNDGTPRFFERLSNVFNKIFRAKR